MSFLKNNLFYRKYENFNRLRNVSGWLDFNYLLFNYLLLRQQIVADFDLVDIANITVGVRVYDE